MFFSFLYIHGLSHAQPERYVGRCMHVCMQQGERSRSVPFYWLFSPEKSSRIDDPHRSHSQTCSSSRASVCPLSVRSCLGSPPDGCWMNVQWRERGEGMRDVILSQADGKEPWNNPVRSRVWSMVLAGTKIWTTLLQMVPICIYRKWSVE